MKTLILTGGHEVLLDDDDYDTFSRFSWCNNRRYAMRTARMSDGTRKTILLHRLVALARDGEHVHHIDGNTFNNTRANLAVVDSKSHMAYHRLVEGPKTGRFRGVSYDKVRNKWAAQICLGHKNLGRFETEEEAARAWDKAAREYYGPSSYQNFK